MGNIFTALKLLPLLVRIVELVIGAGKGELKKDLVLSVFFGLLGWVCDTAHIPNPDSPQFRELVSKAIDEIVGLLNQTGIFKKTPPAPG